MVLAATLPPHDWPWMYTLCGLSIELTILRRLSVSSAAIRVPYPPRRYDVPAHA